VYAILLIPPFPVRILGVVPADPDPDREGSGRWCATLDRILDGWADQPEFDLRWVAAQLARYRIERAGR